MARASSAGSSASGMPALTSSMWAPAATWARASASTRLKSPSFISSASSLRPVGLMRSPIMTNGRSKPITTSRVAELITVWVTWCSSSDGADGWTGCRPTTRVGAVRHRRPPDMAFSASVSSSSSSSAARISLETAVARTSASKPPAKASSPSRSRGVLGLDPGRLGVGGGDDVARARRADPTPLGDVLVGGVDAGLALGPVDRPLELGRQHDLVAVASGLAVHLGRDVAPVDDDDLVARRARHQVSPPVRTVGARRSTARRTAVEARSWRCSNVEPERARPRLGRPPATAGSSVCESSTTRR